MEQISGEDLVKLQDYHLTNFLSTFSLFGPLDGIKLKW